MRFETCDTHVHVFDPCRFPFASPRKFTPGEATVEMLQNRIATLKLSQVVLIQPSVYGENNDCLIDGLLRLGSIARGVAVVSQNTPTTYIEKLHASGVRGARINLAVNHIDKESIAIDMLNEIDEVAPHSWHIQLHASAPMLRGMSNFIRRSNRKFVVDHFGLPTLTEGLSSPDWLQLRELMASGNVFVKLSAPYLVSREKDFFRDLTPVIMDMLSNTPNRILWGSNWPHTQGITRSEADLGASGIEPFRIFDDQAWREKCDELSGGFRDLVMQKNAAELYDFS